MTFEIIWEVILSLRKLRNWQMNFYFKLICFVFLSFLMILQRCCRSSAGLRLFLRVFQPKKRSLRVENNPAQKKRYLNPLLSHGHNVVKSYETTRKQDR